MTVQQSILKTNFSNLTTKSSRLTFEFLSHFIFQNDAQFLTTFSQLTVRLNKFLMDWLLILGLKEGLVKCVTLLCFQTWVILTVGLSIPQLETWQLLFPYCTLKTIANFTMKSKTKIRVLLLDLEYRTRAIIGRSRFEAALVYKPHILGLKNEEFPFLVYKLSVI